MSASTQPWKPGSLALVAAGKRGGQRQRGQNSHHHSRRGHVVLRSPKIRSRWTRNISIASSGACLLNRLCQITAIIAGATRICGKRARFLLLDLAARDAELDQRAHAGEPARDHFAVVEIGDRRKARPLGDDQAHDVAAPRRRDLLDEGLGKPFEHVAHRSAGRRRRLQPADQRHDRGPDQFLEHRFLVLEVQVDRALGDAGAPGDVVEPRRGKAARDEFIHRRLDDRRAPLGRALGAVGWRASAPAVRRGQSGLARPSRPRCFAGFAGSDWLVSRASLSCS